MQPTWQGIHNLSLPLRVSITVLHTFHFPYPSSMSTLINELYVYMQLPLDIFGYRHENKHGVYFWLKAVSREGLRRYDTHAEVIPVISIFLYVHYIVIKEIAPFFFPFIGSAWFRMISKHGRGQYNRKSELRIKADMPVRIKSKHPHLDFFHFLIWWIPLL